MQKISLDAQAREQLERAASTSSGRSATTVYGGHEHMDVPAVRARTLWRSGDLIVIPPARHALQAIDDAAVLLTVAEPG
ncbi:LuxR family transcriptional regulator [Streptomyces afghaniensis]|uniref:LuxR family transcriptional regulator n=1 Tax=Streptomyces afghaniensis TaxID=66865 RepID=UPI002785ECC5|nr:LuxR family transcriptional regulator [Streptomyces afghaniensis]MDQ1014376.1 quercetin dioxygenase-like cupin family protein [Streptomyces afghaniensis]